MTEIKKTKEVIYETVYQANDGTVFESKEDCLAYESGRDEISKEIDKMKIFEDKAPSYFDDWSCHEWYKVKNKGDIELLREKIEYDEFGMETITSFPEYVCVRVNDSHIYGVQTTLTQVIAEYKGFMEDFGYKTIVIKEHNEEIK